MKRRSFLGVLAALPFVGCAGRLFGTAVSAEPFTLSVSENGTYSVVYSGSLPLTIDYIFAWQKKEAGSPWHTKCRYRIGDGEWEEFSPTIHEGGEAQETRGGPVSFVGCHGFHDSVAFREGMSQQW